MSETNEWTNQVTEYAKLKVGENTFQILGEPTIKQGDYGDRLSIPTEIGEWKVGLNSPVARDLKETVKQRGKLAGITLKVAKTGEGKDTRYTIIKITFPEKPHVQPPLEMEKLTPEQIAQFKEYLKTQQ